MLVLPRMMANSIAPKRDEDTRKSTTSPEPCSKRPLERQRLMMKRPRVTGSVDKPPPLHIGRQPRQADDANNRRINIHYQLLKASVKPDVKVGA